MLRSKYTAKVKSTAAARSKFPANSAMWRFCKDSVLTARLEYQIILATSCNYIIVHIVHSYAKNIRVRLWIPGALLVLGSI
jgi:hypothetical protein